MTLEKLGETARFTRRPEQTSRRALTAQGDLEGMERAKQVNGSGHELSIGHSPSSARKKAVRKKAESPRPLRKEAGKMLDHALPQPYGPRSHRYPKLGPHTASIRRLLLENAALPPRPGSQSRTFTSGFAMRKASAVDTAR